MAPSVLFVIKHIPAVHTPRPFAVLLPPTRLGPGRLRLDHTAFGILAEAKVRRINIGIGIFVFGDFALGEAHVGVCVFCGVQVFAANRRVPVIFVTGHPDLFSGVDAYNFFIIFWESDLGIGPRQSLFREKKKTDSVTAQGATDSRLSHQGVLGKAETETSLPDPQACLRCEQICPSCWSDHVHRMACPPWEQFCAQLVILTQQDRALKDSSEFYKTGMRPRL